MEKKVRMVLGVGERSRPWPAVLRCVCVSIGGHWCGGEKEMKTSRGVLFLPPSDAYVRSFLYLLSALIKLYYTKALSNQALSLAPD